MRTTLKAAVAGALTLGALLVPATAHATPSSGVTATILSTTTVGQTDYIVREITVQPGGSTGWHFHDGNLYALVKGGTLTHTDSDCTTTDVYHTGATFIEQKGADKVHIGRNLGPNALVLDVLYVLPHGAPLAEDAPNPGCSFQ